MGLVQFVLGSDPTTTLAAPPTVGNTLFWFTAARTTGDALPPEDGTWAQAGPDEWNVTTGSSGLLRIFFKPVETGDAAAWATHIFDSGDFAALVEWDGLWTVDVSDSGAFRGAGQECLVSLTPEAGREAVLWSFATFNADWAAFPAGWTAAAGMTSLIEQEGGGSTAPRPNINYQEVALTTASYQVGSTGVDTGAHRSAVIGVAFLAVPPGESLPEPGIWFDPDRDGFSESTTGDADAPLARSLPEGSATISDNITPNVIDFSVTQPGDREHSGGSFPTSCTLTVKNEDGRWNTDNTASPYYGKPVLGAPLWIGANADGTLSYSGQAVHGIFGGFVREIVPIPESGLPGGTPTAQIICDDALTEYKDRTARVSFVEGRSVAEYRDAILDAIGEETDRRNLANESTVLAISGNVGDRSPRVIGRSGDINTRTTRIRNAPTNALQLLEQLNRVTGTRHYISPGDTKEEFYRYTTVLRAHKLGDTEDDVWDGVTWQVSNYRNTVESVINSQSAQLDPVTVESAPQTVWRLDEPVAMDGGSYKEIVANFGDYVFDLAKEQSVTGPVTVTLTAYGDGAVIRFDAVGPGTVNNLTLTGRRVLRSDSVVIERRDSSSFTTYRERAGSQISSDYLQSPGHAEGIVNFVLWKFAQPLRRPLAAVVNQPLATLPRELYDVVTMNVAALQVSGRRFEIVGRSLQVPVASLETQSYNWGFDLQETRNQSAMALFRIGISGLGGTDGIAP